MNSMSCLKCPYMTFAVAFAKGRGSQVVVISTKEATAAWDNGL